MDYTKLIQATVSLLAIIIQMFLIPWIKGKIDAEKLKKLIEYVKIAVEAAEQILGGNSGPQKKEFVLSYLAAQGIKFDEQTVNAAIESAVLEMNNNLLNNK